MQHLLRAGSSLTTGFSLSGLNHRQFWFEYFALGGNRSQTDLEDYLSGKTEWPAIEHDIAAHALNEHRAVVELGPPVPYAQEISDR